MTQQIEYGRGRSRLRTLLFAVSSIYPLFLLALSVINTVQPRRTGLLGLSEVFAPYLFLPLLLLLPFALLRGAGILRVMLAVCAIVYGVRFPPRLISAAPEPMPGAIKLSVLHWNVMVGEDYHEVVELLGTRPAAIVGLVEADWHRLSQDPAVRAAYPYMAGVQGGGPSTGQALLSLYPILQEGVIDRPADLWRGEPRAVWARLDVGLGRDVVVAVAHPPPGRLCTRHTFPRGCYDTTTRDRQIAAIREGLHPFLKSGDHLVVTGDFNVTEREPAYAELSAGLLDAHREVGAGTGATWRPSQLMGQPFALLRIDYIFSTPNVIPLALDTDCTPRGSDHCLLRATFEVR